MSFSYPETDEIDSEQAKFLYEEHCANLVIEGLPVGSEFGIDMISFQVGDKFKGVKMIPLGIHIIYASSIDKQTGQLGPRCGFFHNFRKQELHIRRWSEIDEDFVDDVDTNIMEHSRERYSANMRDLDRFLGAYRYSTYANYKALTSTLTPDILQRLMPACKKIRSVPYLVRKNTIGPTKEDKKEDSASSPPKKQKTNEGTKPTNERTKPTREETKPTSESSLLPDLHPDPTTVINFTKIQRASFTVDPKQVTLDNLDTSAKLEACFSESAGKTQLLAEFEFSFVVFLLCHVYECFENWKDLLKLICLANSALLEWPAFFVEFVRVLRVQVGQVPEDMFEDIADDRNLLLANLSVFFENVKDLDIRSNVELKQSASEFEALLAAKFGWRFDLEREDEQPAIVD